MTAAPIRPRKLVGRVLVAAVAATLLLPATAASADAAKLGVVEIKAHRGGALQFHLPEESLALLTRAAESGLAWVESDVVFTSDGVGVLQHSDAIGGGASGSASCTQEGRAIHTMTWAELSLVTCSFEGATEPIARLDDVVTMLASHPGTKVDLEVKTYPGQSVAEKNEWMKQTLIATAPLHQRMTISSFAWRDVAATAKTYAPGTYFLALEYANLMKLAKNNVYANIDRAVALGASGFGFNVTSSDEASLAYLRARGLDPQVYDLVTDQQFRFALGIGQNLLLADDPDHVAGLVSSLLGQRPTPTYRTTRLASRTVLTSSIAKGARAYPRVMGSSGLVPSSAQNQFGGVRLVLKVVAKASSGKVEIAPRGSRVGKDGVRVSVRKGTHSYVVYVSGGDAGKVRVLTTSKKKVKITLSVTGYRTARY